ncbi:MULTISPECIES: helix-turn-helix transcriptional regulator [unclassified Kitasatospora]
MELVGRHQQVGLLTRLLSESRSRGSAVLVRGPAGIGKTALLAEAAVLAEASGYRVLRTSGVEAERGIPYAGLRMLLRPLAAGTAELAAPHRQALEAAQGHAEADIPDVFLVALAALNLIADTAAVAPVLVLHDPADPAFQVALRLTTLGDLVDAATHCGRTAEVLPVVAELEAVAELTPAPVLHADLRLARALLAADGDAGPLFETALGTDLSALPLVRARTHLAFGEWLRRRRRSVESRDHLRTARDMFDALGAIPWGEKARRELRAAGETSRGRAPDVRDRLTPHELQIVRLTADGLTNREIGQRLYLSHRTVSSHLHRIFPKPGVVSRTELRTVAGVLRRSAVM